jgi:hypothetical protein
MIEVTAKIENSSSTLSVVSPENPTPVKYGTKIRIPARSALVVIEN